MWEWEPLSWCPPSAHPHRLAQSIPPNQGLGTVAHVGQTLELQGMSLREIRRPPRGPPGLASSAWVGSCCFSI